MEGDGMTALIHTMAAVQEVFDSTGVSLGLELPRIAVIGGQSAGKSSVLENFVGKDFLPRGLGIVTRRPLVLQLVHSQGEEFATFLHTGDKKYAVGEEVRREIVAETDRETGQDLGISSKPIHLRIHSPVVLDLTLVDLPGMTKVAVGDQPEDIDLQIRSMLLEYIMEENTIILAVSPANQDLANSDALRLAREVDRTGQRTIGVITKLDLMDKGTDAKAILENKVLPLKKGYIGVVNMSQYDIDNRKSITTALSAEQQFFRSSPYRSLAPQIGTAHLQEVLHTELGSHIKAQLPGIRRHLAEKDRETQAKLKEIGYDKDSEKDKGKLVNRLVTKFRERLHGKIDGDGKDVSLKEVNQGAIINRMFYKDFPNIIEKGFDDSTSVDKEISVAVANIHGTSNPLFNSERAFQQIVANLLSRYEKPLTACVAAIRCEVEEAVEESLALLELYPSLQEEVRVLVVGQLIRGEDTTVSHLVSHVQAQKAFMNTRHPDFPQDSIRTSMDSLQDPGPAPGPRTSSRTSMDSLTQIPNQILEEEEMALSRQNGLKNKKINKGIFERMGGGWSGNRANNGNTGKQDAHSTTPVRQAPEVPPRGAPQKPAVPVKQTPAIAKDMKKSKMQEEILGDQLIQDQSSSLKRMVRWYLEIADITIQDMTPKYIMLSLVDALQDYVREELLGDLLAERTPEEQEALVERMDTTGKVRQLLATQEAIRQALLKLDRLRKSGSG